MNPEQRTQESGKTLAIQRSESELVGKARPLFVCGCDRSGTTAFADYLNHHQEILLCQERYKETSLSRITPDLFAFERILEFRPEETKKPPDLFDLFAFEGGLEFRPGEAEKRIRKKRELFVRYHMELLAKKDPAKLKWIGDKYPPYVRDMGMLAGNNPGARFIVLYRPIEEVAESWDIRAKDQADHWLRSYGGEQAVEIWNKALRKTREFVTSSPVPRVLIVSYDDFFYRNEAVVPLISGFLGLELGETVTKAWREASLEYEGRRRRKEQLSEEQRSFIQKSADREAEEWVLKRIERQWGEPEIYAEQSTEATLASLDKIEARMWQLQQRVKELEFTKYDLARERGELRKAQRKAQRTAGRLQQRLEAVEASRTRQLMKMLHRATVEILNLGRNKGSS